MKKEIEEIPILKGEDEEVDEVETEEVEESKEELKEESKTQIVTNEQLIHFKLDNLSSQIRELIDALTGKENKNVKK